jgi:hypothetical protein
MFAHNQETTSKEAFFALKIDMMKAYDMVEWDYLRGCLSKLGFATPWINTVMRCVTEVPYAVKVNGELTRPVVPRRGIRLGDPISRIFSYFRGRGSRACSRQKKILYN